MLDNIGDPRHDSVVSNWRGMSVGVGLLVLLGAAGSANRARGAGVPTAPGSAAGAELIGTAPTPWTLSDWMGSPALTLAGLRGKVVLMRWFTDASCPYCSLTAPTLNRLHQDYAARGLVVIGVYHHKRPEPLDVAAVRGWSHDFGFHFPVAIDRDWRTLHRWWLDGHDRDFTSVSFLLDQRGIIRYVHPGGTLGLGSADYRAVRAQIDALLSR